jgi:hypothetical protein
MLDDLRIFGRYAWGLKDFFRNTLTPEDCYRMLKDQLRKRETSFLRILKLGVYGNPASPYLKLLRHAGIEYGDFVKLVETDGVEEALAKVYEAGVYLTLDEFKGRQPVRRSGLEFSTHPRDFDNTFLAKYYEARSSGSRSRGTRIIIDLDLLTHEAAYFQLFLESFGLGRRPLGSWRELPPSAAGMKLVLRYARLGKPVERWFSQSRLSFNLKNFRFYIFTMWGILASRMFGKPIPMPEHVPFNEAYRIANWLETKKTNGTPAVMDTNVSSAVRICLAAQERGRDIAGTFFRLGGEPYTQAKANIIKQTGSRAYCNYSMTEVGTIGLPCANPEHLDEVHLLTDKIGVIQRTREVGTDGQKVGALLFTTLLPHCPKLMLNVESDDYGSLEIKDCGCRIGEFGYGMHLSNIRSYEKLTSEGVSFLGTELLRILEEVLPSRFGGNPTDYQFEEEEVDGLPKVNIIVSPRVGTVDEKVVIKTVVNSLASYPGGDIMVSQWRRGNTLRVVRREPYTTSSAKILPLHIYKKS